MASSGNANLTTELVEDYTTCDKLRDMATSRPVRLPFGSGNGVSPGIIGNPIGKSGALDRSILCSMRPKESVCQPPPPLPIGGAPHTTTPSGRATGGGSSASLRAVRQAYIHSQQHSFRSMEQTRQASLQRADQTNTARCMRLIADGAKPTTSALS